MLSHFPELGPQLCAPENQNSLLQQLGIFALFTQQAVEEGSLTTLKECLMVADILRAEDEQLARAIQNTYLQRLHFQRSAYSTQLAQLLMPTQLYAVFTQN